VFASCAVAGKARTSASNIEAGPLEQAKHMTDRRAEKLEVNVLGAPVIDQGEIGLGAVRAGAGFFYVADPMVRADIEDGVLRTVLKSGRHWTPGPGAEAPEACAC
jgi:hypothetical protein